jgi:antirestriction protein ArdC
MKPNTMYDEVVTEVLKALDAGTVPWRRPWNVEGGPVNAVTGNAYAGFNAIWLGMTGERYWAGYGQWQKAKAQVRKGEHGRDIFIPKIVKRTEADGTEAVRLVGFTVGKVFSAAQVEGWTAPTRATIAPAPVDAAEAIIAAMPNRPEMVYGGDRACYVPALDQVHLPERTQFKSAEGFYAVAFHELAHSTGHASRLNREGMGEMGLDKYSREELVAEFAAAMLCGASGIAPAVIENAAAYIANWRQFVVSDGKAILTAAAKAQKAADFIRGKVKGAVGTEPAAAVA